MKVLTRLKCYIKFVLNGSFISPQKNVFEHVQNIDMLNDSCKLEFLQLQSATLSPWSWHVESLLWISPLWFLPTTTLNMCSNVAFWIMFDVVLVTVQQNNPFNQWQKVSIIMVFFKTIFRPTVQQCAWNHACMVGHTPKPPLFFTFCCPWQTRRGQVAYKGNVDMIIFFFRGGSGREIVFILCCFVCTVFVCSVVFVFRFVFSCRSFFVVQHCGRLRPIYTITARWNPCALWSWPHVDSWIFKVFQQPGAGRGRGPTRGDQFLLWRGWFHRLPPARMLACSG